MAETTFRLRVCYGKTGRLRFLSHLEVSRTCERSVRRAGLSYAVTQGFNPKMKVGFGPALPVGTAGEQEYFDVWLTQYVASDEVLGELRGAFPDGLSPRGARYVAGNLPSLSASLTIASYDVEVSGPRVGSVLDEAVRAVVAQGALSVRHKGKTKVFDLARSLPEEPRVEVIAPALARVRLVVRIGEEGSLRPESLVHAALELADVQDAVVTVTRTALLEEEEGVRRAPM